MSEASHDEHKHTLRQKPPSREDEFFAREDRERIEQLKEERRKREELEGREKLKALHWMHCPKCGQELVEVEHQGLLIDRCNGCNGVWFDAGEVEALVRKSSVFGWLKR